MVLERSRRNLRSYSLGGGFVGARVSRAIGGRVPERSRRNLRSYRVGGFVGARVPRAIGGRVPEWSPGIWAPTVWWVG